MFVGINIAHVSQVDFWVLSAGPFKKENIIFWKHSARIRSVKSDKGYSPVIFIPSLARKSLRVRVVSHKNVSE